MTTDTHRLAQVEKDVAGIRGDVADLKITVTRIDNTVTDLKSTVTRLDATVTDLKTTVTRLDETTTEIKDILKALYPMLVASNSRVDEQSRRIDDLSRTVTAVIPQRIAAVGSDR